MTASQCIRSKSGAGAVDKRRAEEAATLFDDFLSDLQQKNSPRPEALAGDRALAALNHARKVRRRSMLQQMQVQDFLRSRIMNTDNPLEAALSVLDFDPRSNFAGANVHITSQAIRGQVHARMADFLEQFRTRAAGLDQLAPGAKENRRVALNDLVRELFGENSGSREAKAAAKAVAEGFEFQRKLANASGAVIPERPDWGLPQTHSRRALNSVDEPEWIDFTLNRLDRQKMIDTDTGQPFTDSKLRQVLSDVYQDIVTDGLRNVKPGFAIGRNVARRMSQQRFLVFKNANSWIEYQSRFGEGDAFNAILGHVNAMSRDIALMRILGPNPDATVRFMELLVGERQGQQALSQTGKAGARAAGKLRRGQPQIRDLYAAVSGELNRPGNEFWANVSGANRNVMTSAMLGGAFFSALTDRVFTGITARLNGIPAMRVLGRHMKLFAPGSLADQRLAVQSGFIADQWVGVAVAEQRYLGEVIGPEWSQRLSDSVLRASLLSPWTTAGRHAFQLEFLGAITRAAGTAFEAVDRPLREAMQRHGITAGDWDVISATRKWVDGESGATFVRPQDIIGEIEDSGPLFQQRFEVANKLQSMILTEAEFAVPAVTPRARALLTFGQRPGTFAGEIMRNATLFKSFPVTLVMTQLQRAAFGNISAADKAKYLAHLILGTTVMGTLGEQMSQISKGRDPLPMDPLTEEGRRALFKGLSRGGGLGLFGDFVFADVNRYGGGIENTLLGPVFGSQLPQLTKLTVGNLQEFAVEGQAKNAGRELTRFAKLVTPGRSLWYTTLAMERLVFDEIQKQIDPGYARSFQQIQRRAQSEFNQRFYSPPGSGFPPGRAPELGRALE